jgi:NADPH:quinone reductase-like Zn-dependent oxidoreductase
VPDAERLTKLAHGVREEVTCKAGIAFAASGSQLQMERAAMRAICLRSFGGPDRLEVRDIPRPQPGPGEILIEVHAASVNPVDYKIRSGKYPAVTEEQLPKVLGRDISGVVVARGAAVTDFEEGDEVYAMLDGGPGGYAEYVTVPARLCALKPKTLDYAQAAAVPLAAITAWQGLFDYGDLIAGQKVLIHGGAGGVGHFAIQFAKAREALVATTVSAQDKSFVRSLGADQAIDYKSERFEDLISEVDLVFDLVAGDTQERSWAVLRDGGAMVSTLAKPSERQAMTHHARATNYVAHPDAAELAAIATLIDAGKVRPHIQAKYPLEAAAAAQEQLEHAHTQGKIVLEVAP